MQPTRIHARGLKGEAVVIVVTSHEDGSVTYRLATGERLARDDETGVFTTLDGERAFWVT